MEARPQQFLEGLKVLVIDHDTTIHNAIVEKSIGWNFKVTTCSNASFALTLLREAKGCFDVILIEERISDMNAYDFLQQITQQINIPVIMMGVDGSTSAAMKAIANGACEYCVKPLSDDLIKIMCKHVPRKVLNENKHEQIHVDNGTKETHVDMVEKNNYEPPAKKNRLSWSQAMHQEFLRAVNQFGLDNAKPKKIIEVMNVPGLTREHIASHLQKLRLTLKRSDKVTQLKNEKPKGKWKKSEQDQCHLEAAKSTPELDQNVKNPVIQCDNNFHAPQHSSIFANLFTDQSDVQNSIIQCDNNSHAPQHSSKLANIFPDQSNVLNLIIQCDNNYHALQHSPTFANNFTD